MVKNLQWFIQGETISSGMIVLDMAPYDAILGYDWLKTHSLMNCDWNKKTLEFNWQGRPVKLQGVVESPLQVSPITATQLYKGTKRNDTWADGLLSSLTLRHHQS